MNHLPFIRKWILLTSILAFGATTNAVAKTEQDVKAAYLYNFIKFINWPDQTADRFNLCLLGKDTLNDKLKLLDSRTVRGKTIEVHGLNDFQNQQIESCSILFIGQSEEKFLEEIFSNAGAKPTLTISSIDDFADLGGIIGFIKLGNVIRFEINLKQANETELSISSKLLELANKVVK